MEKKTDRHRPPLRLDAVGEVRRIRDAQHEQLAGRPWEEKVAFFRERAAELARELRDREGTGATESARGHA